jgi:hypothetical protein
MMAAEAAEVPALREHLEELELLTILREHL